jgi:hypothetical protein
MEDAAICLTYRLLESIWMGMLGEGRNLIEAIYLANR